MLKKSTKKIMFWMLLILVIHASTSAQNSPEITSWILSDGTTTCKYYDTNANIIDTGIEANIQAVWYDCDYVWLEATGTPDYLTGPFPDGNPSVPTDQNLSFVITRNPQEETGVKTVNGLGSIGYFINGVGIFNASDGMSYNNQGVWNRDAIFFENDGFDCSRGHPAMGNYHHHQNPAPFNISANPQSTICTTYPSTGLYTPNASQHSSLLGFAIDGFPIYGPYGYANTDGTGGIALMVSGYETRNITQRTTYADGTSVTAGPAVSATYPLGAFIEDYEFTGNGNLDAHNGRFAVTPEYPCGTYAYYITMDTDGTSQYPYIIGPEFYGVVVNCGGGTGGEPVVDCDAIPPPPAGAPCCGDGQCNGSEDSTTCPGDCTGGGSSVSCTPTIGAVQYTGSACVTASAGSDPVLGCNAVNLNGSATGATNYSWCTNDGNILSGSTSLNPSIDQVGTYYLTALDANCCSVTSAVTVTQNCSSNPNVVVQMRVYLEGFYNLSTGLMTTDLYTTGVISTGQPFNSSPWDYSGTESLTLSAMPANTVDWVLVEVRDAADNFSIVEQKAALLLSNGDVVDIDGVTSGVNFSNITSSTNYYLSVKSRNHLGVISNTTVNLPNTITYDFTNNANVFENSSQISDLGNDSYALYAGDMNSDGVISVADFNVYVFDLSLTNQYIAADLDGNNSVTIADFNAYRPNASIIGVPQIRY